MSNVNEDGKIIKEHNIPLSSSEMGFLFGLNTSKRYTSHYV